MGQDEPHVECRSEPTSTTQEEVMPTPSEEIIQLLAYFSVALTAPTFTKVLVLICGTILATVRRTVASALRAVGLGNEKNFVKYHRVLNRDRWSPWVLASDCWR